MKNRNLLLRDWLISKINRSLPLRNKKTGYKYYVKKRHVRQWTYFKTLAYIIDYKSREKKYETSSSYTFPCSFAKKKNFARLIQRKSVLVNVKSSNNISFIKISKVREIMPPSGETNENATLILILSSKTSQFRIGRRIVSYRIVFERRVDGEPIALFSKLKISTMLRRLSLSRRAIMSLD